MRLSLRRQQILWGYIFIGPWIIGTLLLFAWPLGRSLLLSFQKVTGLVQLKSEWAGLANYSEAFREDVRLIPTLTETLGDLALDLPLILVFSLIMAILLARVRRGQTTLRAIFFMPVVIGSAGVIQELLRAGAGDEIMMSTMEPILVSSASSPMQGGIVTPIQAVLDRLTLIIWRTGVQILLFVAGLNSIPPSLYEAAYVDGSTDWEAFWKITLPMLSPVILVAAIYTLVDSFTDPLNKVVNYIMDVSIGVSLRLDYGAALGWIYFVLVFVLIALLLRLSAGLVFYAGERT
jgi:ABC-type sugar transport system permease subunit